jgi:hypothetical protein
MTIRYDVCAPRPGREGKTFWHRIGSAFKSDKGGIGIVLDSLPLPDKDGKVSFQLFEPKAKAQASNGQASAGDDMSDSIPF